MTKVVCLFLFYFESFGILRAEGCANRFEILKFVGGDSGRNGIHCLRIYGKRKAFYLTINKN